MAFHGDVAQIPLSNILQALLLNGQEGILRLELGAMKRRIRLLKKGLRLLNHDSDSPDLLKHILLKQKILTEAQFQNIFSTWVPGSTPPGDFLMGRRILTPEIVTTQVIHHLQDILLEVLLTPRLKYEFTAEEDATPFEMFSPAGLGDHLIFNSNALLMEAVRREDEWRRYREEIRSGSEIFTICKGVLSAKDLQVTPEQVREVKPLLNGECTVDRMISSTTLTAFEVYQVLFELKKKNLIRTLDLGEKRSLADKFRRALRTADALEISRSILSSDPTDRPTRLHIVSILEKTPGSQEEIVEHYLQLAAGLEDTNKEEAKTFLQKVLAISPWHMKALDLLFHLHHATNNHREGLAVARAVITAAKSQKSTPDAVDLLYKILNYYPDEAVLFHELAEIHLLKNDSPAALECLKSAADIYERKREYTRLRKTYEKIIRFKPDETGRLRRIIHLEQKTKRTSGRILKFAGYCALVGALSGGALYLGMKEVCSRSVYAGVLTDIEVQRKFGRFDRAKHTLEDFERLFPLTTRMRDAQDLLKEINRSLITRQEENRANHEKQRLAAEAELARARVAIKDNDYVKAYDLLSRLELEGLKTEESRDITALLSQLRKYFADAEELLRAAELADKNQDLAQGHVLRRQILSQFPHSRTGRELTIPVLVESIPPGADLIIDGKLIGQTPVGMRVSAIKLPSILLSKKGYAAIYLNKEPVNGSYFSPLDSHRIVVPLEKSVEWKFDSRASVEGFPVVVGDNVCFGTRNGDIMCLRQDTGEVVWTFPIPGSMDFSGGLGLWNDMLYFGSYDGNVYVIGAQNGKPVHPPFQASAELWPIKHAPSAASEKGLVAVNCDKRVLSAFNVGTGKAGWALSFTTTKLLGQPLAYQGRLYVATQAGEILEIDHDTGQVLKKISLNAELQARGRPARDRYYVGTAQGKFLALDLKNGQVAWSYDCGEPIASPPIVDGEWAIVTTSKGRLFCFTTDGTLKWGFAMPDPVPAEADGIIFRNNLYIGTKQGQVLCIDIWSGRTVWHFKTAGFFEKEKRGILASGIVSKGKLFVGAEDHLFYCFPLD